MLEPRVAITKPSDGYELLDSGDGEKLERYGEVVVSRPDPQALWEKRNPALWKTAHAVFSRDNEKAGWKIAKEIPAKWQIALGGLNFWIKPSSFKHTGLFPEQLPNWQWTTKIIEKSKEPVRVLNLFGYTGGATLAAAKAGGDVCHVDGSKVALSWARDNAEASGLADKPIRWILDDAQKFVKREMRRERVYEGIILDPPAFGHGPEGETWKIEEHFVPFLHDCFSLLSDKPKFVLINGYASGYSAIAYHNNLLPLVEKYGGTIEVGELTIEETGPHGRLLPCGIFARWTAK